jgi:hypothetical protein
VPTAIARLAATLTCVVIVACDNPFAPPTTKPPPTTKEPVLATTPQTAIDNLELAFLDRDKDLYETLLDESFWFTEADCGGQLVMANGRETELEIMGTRDGVSKGIFGVFRNITWTFEPSSRFTELGRDYPRAFEGDPDGHPEEDWEVFRGRVEMWLLEEADQGFRVSQVMNFKMRRGDDGLWRIVRWIDDPLVGDCGGDGLI